MQRVGRVDEQARDEPEGDHEQHGDDELFEQALRVTAFEQEQHRRHRADDEPAHEQRQSEQQVQRDGAADELRQIGGDGDDLGLHEEHEPTGVAHALAQQFRQGFAGDHAEFGGLVLDEHAHDVGQDQHPYQQITVACAGSDVRGHIARIDVGDRGDEGRSQDAGERMAARFPAAVRTALMPCRPNVPVLTVLSIPNVLLVLIILPCRCDHHARFTFLLAFLLAFHTASL